MPDDVSTSFKAASGPEIHQASPQKQTHLEVSDGGEGHEVLRGAQFSLLHTVHLLSAAPRDERRKSNSHANGRK